MGRKVKPGKLLKFREREPRTPDLSATFDRLLDTLVGKCVVGVSQEGDAIVLWCAERAVAGGPMVGLLVQRPTGLGIATGTLPKEDGAPHATVERAADPKPC